MPTEKRAVSPYIACKTPTCLYSSCKDQEISAGLSRALFVPLSQPAGKPVTQQYSVKGDKW